MLRKHIWLIGEEKLIISALHERLERNEEKDRVVESWYNGAIVVPKNNRNQLEGDT